MTDITRIKISLIGSESVGKSTIVEKFIKNEFKDKYQVI